MRLAIVVNEVVELFEGHAGICLDEVVDVFVGHVFYEVADGW